MTIETRQFNFMAWMSGIAVLVFLGGAVFALYTHQITFDTFAAAVGSTVSALLGWAARGMVR